MSNLKVVGAVIAITTLLTFTGCQEINNSGEIREIIQISPAQVATCVTSIATPTAGVTMSSTSAKAIAQTTSTTQTTTSTTEITTSTAQTTEETIAETTTSTAETTEETITQTTEEALKVAIYPEMDISATTGMTEHQFTELMENLFCDYTGYFERNASVIWNLCQNYQINELAFCGIIAQESGWAQVGYSYNYFGIAGGRYGSEQEGLEAFASLLGKEYLNPNGAYYNGTTLSSVGQIYSASPDWADAVYGCMCYLV